MSDLETVVCDHVSPQVAEVVEAGGALFAGVGFLPRVSPQMDLQASAVREALPALRAGVRLLPCVNAQVDGQRGLFEKGLPAIGTNAGVLAHVGCPVLDQVFGTEEAPAAEAAVKVLGDIWNEDVRLLGELADIARVAHHAVRPDKGHFHYSWCQLSGSIFQLTVSHQFNTLVLLRSCHWHSVSGGLGEIKETIVGDAVFGRQGAKVLKFGGSEEAILHVLQRAFPSSVDAQNPQLVASIRCTGGP